MGLDTGTGFSEFLFFRYVNMLALRAGTEAGWVLAYAPILSESLFFRYLET